MPAHTMFIELQYVEVSFFPSIVRNHRFSHLDTPGYWKDPTCHPQTFVHHRAGGGSFLLLMYLHQYIQPCSISSLCD